MNTKVIAISIALLVVPWQVGCTGFREVKEAAALRGVIHDAYDSDTLTPPPGRYSRHYERGWKQGYYNISKGADPCPPSVAPEPYWSIKYQNPEGAWMAKAWFDGYARGAQVAMCAGVGQYNKLPVGPHCPRASSFECTPRGACQEGLLDDTHLSIPMGAAASNDNTGLTLPVVHEEARIGMAVDPVAVHAP